MIRNRMGAALLVVSNCCLAEAPRQAPSPPPHAARFQAQAAYPPLEAAAVWRSLGASYVRKAIKDNQLVRDPSLNARLDAVVTTIGRAAATLYPRYAGATWRALLIDEFGHGAVAFPGGTILVDASFVRRLEMTDDELALLLAHEIAHVVADHPSEKLSFVADTLGKDKAPTAGSALHAFFAADTYALMFQPTARLQEREADVIGAAVLFASGYDSGRALQLFDKLARLENGNGGLETATHDAATARRHAVSQVIDGLRRGLPRSAR
jgi:predicted Zn-dependent protease